MKSSGVCVLSCSAFRGSDRFTATVSIRHRQGFLRAVEYVVGYASHGPEMSEDEQAWRSWPVDRREREYSPSSCVDALLPLLEAYAARSREAEQRSVCRKDLRWGEAADETFDFFPAVRADAPLLLFI